MRRLIPTTLAAAAALFSTAALAADYGPPPVLRESLPAAQPVDNGGWYLRGDIGVAAHSIGSFDVLQNGQRVRGGVGGVNEFQLRSKSYSETVSIAVGLGYRFNSWFRVDVTGELRGGGSIRGLDYVSFAQNGGTTRQTNNYHGHGRTILAMANAYVDLGTFCTLGCLTPYLGAGVGFAQTTISSFTDTSTGFNDVTGATGAMGAYATTASKTSFAWALMAGVGYKVNERLTLELGYRYLSLGEMPSLLLRDPQTGLAGAGNPTVRVSQLTGHEIKVGMRWSLNCSCAVPAEPIVARY
jgi:opacity protein-like surface antigen